MEVSVEGSVTFASAGHDLNALASIEVTPSGTATSSMPVQPASSQLGTCFSPAAKRTSLRPSQFTNGPLCSQ